MFTLKKYTGKQKQEQQKIKVKKMELRRCVDS